ncbi:putative epoxide hydrolase domain protein [Mycobacterium xenopi 3993]|nr:putative epoxide hydrolase domain protein [Mycobacterium xenopi 3993]
MRRREPWRFRQDTRLAGRRCGWMWRRPSAIRARREVEAMDQYRRGNLVFDVIGAGPPTGRLWCCCMVSLSSTPVGVRSSTVSARRDIAAWLPTNAVTRPVPVRRADVTTA